MQHTMNPTRVHPADHSALWESLPALQQPHWRDHAEYALVRRHLTTARPLVSAPEVLAATRALASVASGSARVLQIGDCAESFADATAARTALKVAVINQLAERMGERTGQDVVRFGRMAGQYAKPRSSPTELVDGITLPPYRGDLVNSIEPNALARRHDPRRMLRAHQAGGVVMDALRRHWRQAALPAAGGPWSSHEALVIDYESPLVRVDPLTGQEYLGSTHFPWIGERTRQLDHAHVRLLMSVVNPIACKLGPTAAPDEVVRLCALLDPYRVPGRLTLIIRMGQSAIARSLPAITRAVRRAGHPVVWLCDPMHGNTVRTSCGRKTRRLDEMISEATAFRRLLEADHFHPGGLHLEVASTDVTECVGGDVRDERALGHRYETLCDPRLNPEQALELLDSVF